MKSTLYLSTATAALLLVAAPLTGHAQVQPQAGQQSQQGRQFQQPPAYHPDATRQPQANASRPFTRVQIRTAAELTGKPLLDAAGGVVGEIEYLLIDIGSANVRFAIVGRGGVLDLGEQLIAVPWAHIRATDGMPLRIDAFMEDLEGAPRLDWSTLRELTEPNFVTRLTNYFAPIVGQQGGTSQPRYGDGSSRSQPGSQFQERAGQQAPSSSAHQMTQADPQTWGSGQQRARDMQERQGTARDQGEPGGQQTGAQAQGQTAPMTPDGMQTMLRDQSIGGPSGEGSGRQLSPQSAQGQQSVTGDQQPSASGGGQQQAQTGGRQDQQAQQQRQAQGSATQSRQQQEQRGQQQAQRSQGQQDVTGFILVGRSIVTTLAPPAFRFASGLRGAEVIAQDGSEIGEVANLMIDVQRGRVAYVTIAQGGFLGLGETMKAVPLQALDWVAPETLRLEAPRTALDKMPNLTGDVPTMVRRSDLEKLYQHFGLTPNWQQT